MNHLGSNPHGEAKVLHYGRAIEEAHACVVLLHGRGATAESILDLGRVLDRPAVAFVAPQAANVGYGPAWYPYSFLAPLSQNEPWLSSALSLVERIVDDLSNRGIPRDRVILAGFSQGACLASEVAARNPARYGGVIALSGGLIGSGERRGVEPPADKLFEYEGSLDGTPVFLGCSDRDPHIPVERVHATADTFEAMDGSVDERIYEGMGHTVNDDEIEAFRAIVDASLS